MYITTVGPDNLKFYNLIDITSYPYLASKIFVAVNPRKFKKHFLKFLIISVAYFCWPYTYDIEFHNPIDLIGSRAFGEQAFL